MAAHPASLMAPSNNIEQELPEVEAVLELEGLAMAGLVDVLRQLGDLAELAAEVLDGLQDQVMAVSARGRRLAMRAKRLQAADLTTSITYRLDWQWHPRPNLNNKVDKESQHQHHEHGVVGGEAPPRSIVDRIKRCRGPPNLSALDRFDAHGEGACLKRYTDPSFFRTSHSATPHHSHDCRSQTIDAKQSVGFLSMLRRQLTHRQTTKPVSVSPNSLINNLPKYYEPNSAEDYDSETGGSPEQPHMEVGDCSGGELERTSSFEAWLSPGARFSTHEYDDTVHHAKQQDSEAAETSCNKGEMIASRVVNSCSQDTKVDAPPLVPIPPLQWLSSVKVHTGPITTNRIKQAYPRCAGNTVSDPEANKHGDPSQADSDSGHEDEDSVHHESLAGMSPPWETTRPKHPLPEDRITLRNGPSPVHRSRSILDS